MIDLSFDTIFSMIMEIFFKISPGQLRLTLSGISYYKHSVFEAPDRVVESNRNPVRRAGSRGNNIHGFQSRDIILFPRSGVARLERIPTNPLQELWVALAGPAVNGVIAVSLVVWLKIAASFEPMQMLTITTGPFLERIMAVNLFLRIT